MKFLKGLFYKLPVNIAECYKGKNLIWQMIAFVLTYALVQSGFDWKYFQLFGEFGHGVVFEYLIPAALIGFFIPVLLAVFLLAVGELRKNAKILNTGYAISQAAFLGWLVSSFYKSLTGRVPPAQDLGASTADISHVFHFGFWRAGIFWGWPSSHTTIAFAVSVVLIILYRKNKLVQLVALLYAIYIGIGVSVSIHWFSDFVAGAIIGTVIGIVVGKSFLKRAEAFKLE